MGDGQPSAPSTSMGGGKADGVDAELTTVRFAADYTVSQSGPIVAGQKLRVRYDLDRLPDCRGTQGGYPQWNITGYFSVDGGAAKSFEVSEVQGDDRVAKDAVLTVPAGRDLALWFSVTNRWGCNAYDSDGGNNYHLTIE
jgi:hypothetical protein